MNRLALIAIALWLVTVGFMAFFFIRGSTERSTDNRLAVKLSASERDLVLGEMRTLLTAVNGVLNAVGDHDINKAATAAKSAGMAMAVDVNPALMAKLPLEFKTLGMSTHKDFDELGVEIEKGMQESQIIRRLGQLTNKCLACHSVYRFAP